MAKLIAAFLTLTLWVAESHAQGVNIMGVGTQACGVWTQHSMGSDTDHIVLATWVDGFLSGLNTANLKTGKSYLLGQSMDANARDAWITAYCQAHPADTLYAAAQALARNLQDTGR